MTQWMKTLVGGMCILNILLHLIPDGQFAKYVRFYAGLLFFLMIMTPVLEFFGSEESLEQLLQLQFLKEEYADLESAAQGLSELRNERILQAYQAELERQMSGIVEAYGLEVTSVMIAFDDDGYSIERVSVTVADFETDTEMSLEEGEVTAIEKAKQEITELYLLPDSAISFTVGAYSFTTAP